MLCLFKCLILAICPSTLYLKKVCRYHIYLPPHVPGNHSCIIFRAGLLPLLPEWPNPLLGLLFIRCFRPRKELPLQSSATDISISCTVKKVTV